jgi:hypothetical protein
MKYIVDESQFKLLLNKLKPSIFKYWDKNGPGLTNNFYSTFSISSFKNVEYVIELLSEWMGGEEKLIKFIKKDEGETFRIIDGGYNFQIILDEVTVNEYKVYLHVRVMQGGTVTLIFHDDAPTLSIEDAVSNDRFGWEISSEIKDTIFDNFFKFFSEFGFTIEGIDIDYM